ncbi:hypothetical protein RCL1_004697 [Eukaryota sp. TZLM3-RCL]
MIVDLCLSSSDHKKSASVLSQCLAQLKLFGYNAACIETFFTPSPKAVLPPPSTLSSQQHISSLYQIQANKTNPSDLKVYSRLTITLESRNFLHFFNSSSPALRAYDLVAVRPTSEDTFRLACSDLEIDVITLDLHQQLPFYIKIKQVKQALSRGIYFEIRYKYFLLDAENNFNMSRIQFCSNVTQLLNITKGKNCFFSSGAQNFLDLRTWHDVANFSSLFSIDPNVGRSMIVQVPFQALQHAMGRKAERSVVFHEKIESKISEMDS